MGIDYTGLRALFLLKRTGSADFSKVVSLGRHEIFFHRPEFEFLKSKSNLAIPYSTEFSNSSFQEPLLKALGAREVHSIDASNYEGASIISDFNRTIPEEYRNRFSLYLDFGSMEHVFNVAQVVVNINNLLQESGTAVILTNANGNVGHGFYQFSPEFFFSTFSPRNGFRDTAVFLIDQAYPKDWLAVKSPAILKARNEIKHDKKWYVLCYTRKATSIETAQAQQSDYSDVAWGERDHRHQMDSRKKFYHNLIRFNPPLYIAARDLFYHAKIKRKFSEHAIRFNPESESIPFQSSDLSIVNR